MFVGFAGAQNGIGEGFLIRGVRVDLGFQAETVAVFVVDVVASGEAAIKVVACVELNAGLVGKYFQDAACGELRDFCGQGDIAILIV